MDLDIERPGDKGRFVVRAEVRVLELKAATSWCQNFPAEGRFRDAIFCVRRCEMGDPMGLGGYLLTPMSSAGAEVSKTPLSRIQKHGHLATAQKVPGVDLPDMGDGVGPGNEVSAGGAESLISLCIPW